MFVVTRDRGAQADEPSSPRRARRNVAAEEIVDRFEIRLDGVGRDFAQRWHGRAGDAAATAFQSGRWLDAWYATIGRAVGEPILLAVSDPRSGELAAMLPLVRRTQGRLRLVEFADQGVSDLNAPVLGPAAPGDAAGAASLWRAVRQALGPGADLVRFNKMPAEIEGRINPLVLLPSARRSAWSGHVATLEGSWDAYLSGLKGLFRRQLDRSWRAFLKHDGAAFRRVRDRAEAGMVLAALEGQQSARLRGQGLRYRLDEPPFAAFYQKLVADGLAEGSAILTTLTRRDEVVAALLGVARGRTYVMIRSSAGAPEWSSCSPGRLVIARTMEMLHAEGFRHFDFSIGDYAFKRRFGARSRPLFDLTDALSARGWPTLAYDRGKQLVRRHPMLHGAARRFLKAVSGGHADRNPD